MRVVCCRPHQLFCIVRAHNRRRASLARSLDSFPTWNRRLCALAAHAVGASGSAEADSPHQQAYSVLYGQLRALYQHV